MMKVIKPGKKVLIPEEKIPDIPESPPALIETVCWRCEARLETEENETARRGYKDPDADQKQAGWYVGCPCCETDLFIPFLGRLDC